MIHNTVLDRLYVRLLAASDGLREAAESIEDREAATLNEIADLGHQIGEAARSLDLCSIFLRHFERDALMPGTSEEALDARTATQLETLALNTIHNALAGKTP